MKGLAFVLCILMSWWSGEAWSANGKVIYVATDIHVMDSSLVIHEGNALTYYIGRDRKMLSQSVEAFQAVVDSAIIHQADVLLICGDLTKDGEKISHERVSRMLGKALQAGIKIFVIPGNHDIRNPFAKYFDGDKTSPAEGVTAEEFASIYRDFGYGDDVLRDPNSLSYVCEPVPGVTLLAIDASQYEKNTYIAAFFSHFTFLISHFSFLIFHKTRLFPYQEGYSAQFTCMMPKRGKMGLFPCTRIDLHQD